MSVTIHVPQPLTKARLLKSIEDPGRKVGRLGGGWLDDQIALGKLISLCPLCLKDFNPKRYRYELWRHLYTMAQCSVCRATDPRCKSFIPESLHEISGDTRRRGRWAT